MAKVKIKGLDNAKRSVQKQITDAVKEEKLYDDLADTVRERVRKDARRPADGTRYRRLEDSTVDGRRRIARNNATHPSYSLKKPNLTITGEFLDSLTSSFNKSKLTISLFFKGTHKGYKRKKGGRGKPVRNEDIADRQRELGRGVLTKKDGETTALSKKIIKEVSERIKEELRRKFR